MFTLPALPSRDSVWRWTRNTLVALGLIVAAVFVYREDGLGGLWPERETLGQIYADSPEIYTRERLVNDRYIQDGFLKLELEKLKDWTPKPQTAILRDQIKQLGPDVKDADKLALLAKWRKQRTYSSRRPMNSRSVMPHENSLGRK